MTTLRQAAQQALEALKMMRDQYEEYACPACDHADAAIYALKEALVEDAMQKFTDVNQELEAALAEPVQEPKPVAWLWPHQLAELQEWKNEGNIRAWSGRGPKPDGVVPVYTAP